MYGREIDGTRYDFGHEGMLYRESFIMYDKQTNSLWIHSTGEAVKGPAKGKVLPFLPSTVCTWKTWKRLHPQTTVLTGKRARGFMGKFRFADGPEKYGLSVGQGAKPKLYPFSLLMKQRIVNDEHAGRKVVVVYDAESRTARAFDRGTRTFTWKDGALKDGQGRAWNLLRGTCVADGTAARKDDRMEPVPATVWLTDRWRGFHPRGAAYSRPAAQPGAQRGDTTPPK